MAVAKKVKYRDGISSITINLHLGKQGASFAWQIALLTDWEGFFALLRGMNEQRTDFSPSRARTRTCMPVLSVPCHKRAWQPTGKEIKKDSPET